MATTSSNLTASAAISGQGSNGKNAKGRAVGLVATAALGLGLLGGLVFGQVHQVPPSAGAQDLYPAILQGSQPMSVSAIGPRSRAGMCRADGGACVPDEDLIEDVPTPASAAAESPFIPGPFTYREDHRGETPVRSARALPELLLCDTRA